jgi:ADP-heptose:LPS heptosyltransferase
MIRELLIRWWARRDEPREFTFPTDLQRARHILVLMPLSIETLRQSEFFLARLPQAFPEAKVTLLYPPKTLAPRFSNPYGFQIVVPADSDVGWWGRPRRRFLDELFQQPFDVIIALNKEPAVYYAAVAVASGTPVRIGMPGGMGHPFVTVELRHGRPAADVKTEFILFGEMIRKLAASPSPASV